jgi:hypothetical protein
MDSFIDYKKQKPLRRFANPSEALYRHLLKTFSHDSLQMMLQVSPAAGRRSDSLIDKRNFRNEVSY